MTKREHSDTSSDSSSAISEFSEEEEEIDVDFDFLKPSEIDFHGLKSLVKELMQFEQSDFIDYLLSLQWGTVVKIDDQKDPFSVVTLVDLQDSRCAEFLKLVQSKFGDNLDFTKRMGLVLSNRLINMPPQIAPPSWDLLRSEIKETIKDKKLKPFDCYIYISKIYYSCGKETKTRKKDANYFQAEDEFIEPFASKSFDYELDNQQVSDSRRVFTAEGIDHARRVFVLEPNKLDLIVKNLQTNVI